MQYFRGIANPVGIKAGPSLAAQPQQLVEIIERVWGPDASETLPAGKISVITRLGVDNVRKLLPGLLRAAVSAGVAHKIVWVCDACHGNTKLCAESGRKYVDATEQ